jgi:tetratricopeptide (TPR) repeat protein
MPADDPLVHQRIGPRRDAYVAARDIHIHAQNSAPSRRIWGNVPARNPGFTGRQELLRAIRAALVSGERAVVQALHGMGGVGKTQLAIEYAHRYSEEYEVIWWLNAENSSALGEQFSALAAELECSAPDTPLDSMRRAVLMALHQRGRYLLIVDNANNPEDISIWLPGGTGHVLITSRAHSWHEFAVPVEVDVLARVESVAILRNRVHGLSLAGAEKVAEAVGDLPLAVAQAAGYMADTGIPFGEYVRLLRDHAIKILDQGRPATYRASLTVVTQLAFEQLRKNDQASAQIAAICAFMAPEIIPTEWFTRAANFLPNHLEEKVSNTISWRQMINQLRSSAVVRLDSDGLLMHRLTQSIIRSHLPSKAAAFAREAAENILSVNIPHRELRSDWHSWARVLPHLLVLEPAILDSAHLRHFATGAWYLHQRGETRHAHNLVHQLYGQWQGATGKDQPGTLHTVNNLTIALYGLGEYATARDLDEDTLRRLRRLLGEDHPDTLRAASNLAGCLYIMKEYQAAKDLHEDTLSRQRRILGADHPDTQRSARNLVLDIRALRGEVADTNLSRS